MRPLTATIRLDYLRHNYQWLKKQHGGKLLAVVKADAYGHGAVRCAQALADCADGFAVACVEEAIELRAAGICQPIVLLEGVFAPEEYAAVAQHQLSPVVQCQWQLEALLSYEWQTPVTVWLKMDTGMHRVGFFPQHFASAHEALAQCRHVAQIINMSHFACADELANGMTAEQIAAFDTAIEGLAGEQSLANSAAILAHPKSHRHWGRAGLALYGVSSFAPEEGVAADLKPVMQLTTKIFTERTLRPDEPIGYGAAYHTPHSMRIGVAACGYADGYPRSMPSGMAVMVDGRPSQLVGRVSMDMLTVALDDHHQGVGSEVELWGEQVSVAEVAKGVNTVAYELLCHLKRAQRIYREG